ncbi:MAG: hypothetical protein ABI164_02760, partial [Acidobacteriaceae bacterium]
MNRNRIASTMLLAAAIVASAIFAPVVIAQNGSQNAEFVLTALAKGSHPAPLIEQKDVNVLVRNRPAEITSFQPARGATATLQLVFLFDDSAPGYLALQIPTLRKFIEGLPASTEVAVAYMQNGRAVMAQTLTADHTLAGKSLRLTNSIP